MVKVCEIRKLRVYVGNSKVMRYSRYGWTWGRMRVILNAEPLEEGIVLIKYLGSQVATDGG